MRYVIRAVSEAGTVEFQQPLTITSALDKAAALKEAQFRRITLINIQTGVEITGLEELVRDA